MKSIPNDILQKGIQLFLIALIPVMMSGCATIAVRTDTAVDIPVPIYPATCLDLGVVAASATGSEYWGESLGGWYPVLFVGGIIDLPFSLCTDTICLLPDVLALFNPPPPESDIKVLKRSMNLNGVVFPEGSLMNRRHGKFNGITLSERMVVNGIIWEKETFIKSLYNNGRFKEVKLATAKEVQGIKCGSCTNQGLYSIVFRESGKVREAYLSEDQEFGGVKLAGKSRVLFHENGLISKGYLSDNQTFNGIRLAAKSIITFYDSGSIKWATLTGTNEIQGIRCGDRSARFDDGANISFYSSGIIHMVNLSEPQLINGIKCGPNAPKPKRGYAYSFDISLDGSGRLIQAYLAEDQVIDGVICAGGRRTEFYNRSGKIKTTYLAKTQKVHGVELPGGTFVEFTNKGNLKSACLSQDYDIQDKNFLKNKTVYFDMNGNAY